MFPQLFRVLPNFHECLYNGNGNGNEIISICNDCEISLEIECHDLSALMSKFVYLLFSQSAYVFIKVCSRDKNH